MIEADPSSNDARTRQFRFGIACITFALTFTGLMLATNYSTLTDGDTFWHIATGRWIAENGAVPHRDIFTYSLKGEVWLAKEWLSQLILYIAYALSGWKGVNAMALLLVALTVAIVNWVCVKSFKFTVAIGLTFIIMVFSSVHYLARPHMLAYPIMLIWTMGLVAAVDRREVPSYWLLPLMVLWANLHGGFTLGLLIAGLLSLETIFSTPVSERRQVLIRHALFLFLAAAAAMVTPFGVKSILITPKIFGLGEVLDRVQEWQTPDFHVYEFHLFVILILLGLALFSGFKLKVGRLGSMLVVMFLMFKHLRVLPVFGFLMPILMAKPVNEQFPSLGSEHDRDAVEDEIVVSFLYRHVRWLPIVAAGILTAGLAAAVLSKDFDGAAAKSNPVEEVKFAMNHGLTGNVFNDYDFGGYLIFSGIPTFIDGRAELFGKDFFKQYYAAAWQLGDADIFAILDKYDATWALLRPDSGGAAALDLSPEWKCVFEGKIAVLHVRAAAPGSAKALKAAEQNPCKRSGR